MARTLSDSPTFFTLFWRALKFVTAVTSWVIVTIWVSYESVRSSPFLAIVGFVAGTGVLVALRMARRSWALSFGLAALISIGLTFGIFLIASLAN